MALKNITKISLTSAVKGDKNKKMRLNSLGRAINSEYGCIEIGIVNDNYKK